MLPTDEPFPTPGEAEALRAALPPGIRFGTSSWTFPGWAGLLYGGRYPSKANAAALLGQYAACPLFGTVGIDSTYYRPLEPAQLEAYAAALPPAFPCVSKVWNRITLHTATVTAHGFTRGERNPGFLDATLFLDAVAAPMARHFRAHCGPLVFEFPWIPKGTGLGPERFAAALDVFFSALPRELPYAVEVRNVEFLGAPYFAVLREHGVGHVFNAWTRMPRIGYQLELEDCVTAPFVVCRALQRPGMTYEEGVEAFAPFDRLHAPDPDLRDDLVALAGRAVALGLPAYIIVNNKAEGSAPLTVAAVARRIARG
ncbi:MAG: DUF72 domain-containing protein [Gemmatimonadales bacterium]|nr:DUF72 domain-containing protein [Gemmatimonadales bacterium]